MCNMKLTYDFWLCNFECFVVLVLIIIKYCIVMFYVYLFILFIYILILYEVTVLLQLCVISISGIGPRQTVVTDKQLNKSYFRYAGLRRRMVCRPF